MKQRPVAAAAQRGFTLLEVLLATGILASISVFAITSISNQMTIRNKLAGINESQHALNAGMTRVFDDVRHAYVLSKSDSVAANVSARPVRPVLYGKGGNLYFSAQNFNSLIAASPQSNIAMVRYYEREDPKDSARKQLVRVVDTDLRESIERAGVGTEQIVVHDLKQWSVLFWNGQDWTPEWDTNSADSSGKLPKMAKISIVANMPLSDEEKQRRELDPAAAQSERPSLKLEAIAYLMFSAGQPDVKEPSKEYKWQ